MKSVLLVFLSIVITLFSVQKNYNRTELLISGYWIYSVEHAKLNRTVFFNSDTFDTDLSGYKFFEDGTALYRNGGPCGTPPITYTNDPMNYKLLSDTTISMMYENSIVEKADWVIVSLKDSLLELIMIDN